MARQKKSGVDYFPHQCSHGETIFILERQFGNDGYAAWYKILENLGKKSTHFLDCSNATTWEYLKAKTHLEDEKLTAILNLLATLEAIDLELWTGHKVIWSDNFISGIAGVYAKRHTDTPLKPVYRAENDKSAGISGPDCAENDSSAGQPVSESTQSKESKESKLEKRASPGHFEDRFPELKEVLIWLSENINKTEWAQKKKFNPYQFIQAHVKYHPDAILLTLKRLAKEGELIKTPWPWAVHVVEEESKNCHARDGEAKHIATIKAFKKLAAEFDFEKLGLKK